MDVAVHYTLDLLLEFEKKNMGSVPIKMIRQIQGQVYDVICRINSDSKREDVKKLIYENTEQMMFEIDLMKKIEMYLDPIR